MSNYKLIAIEGIDRLGKSTFIERLFDKLIELDSSKNYVYNVEKPTIGLNTIDKNNYPLKDVNGIFEIRHIGLFEELLFQIQQHIKLDCPKKCVIRDRFHLSELAYGKIMRLNEFKLFGNNDFNLGYQKYLKWNNWFENQLLATGIKVYLITFVLENSDPNEDEVKELTKEKLKEINEEFIAQYENSILPKKIIKLKKILKQD
jgi:Thymidylate kinase.